MASPPGPHAWRRIATDHGRRATPRSQRMTPEQLALVRETAGTLEDAGDAFARRFYDRLFALHPSAGAHFPVDPRQGGAFLDEVLFLATAAGDLPVFVERARELGRRQQGSGLETTDYPFLGEALLDAVRYVAGDG